MNMISHLFVLLNSFVCNKKCRRRYLTSITLSVSWRTAALSSDTIKREYITMETTTKTLSPLVAFEIVFMVLALHCLRLLGKTIPLGKDDPVSLAKDKFLTLGLLGITYNSWCFYILSNKIED